MLFFYFFSIFKKKQIEEEVRQMFQEETILDRSQWRDSESDLSTWSEVTASEDEQV